MDFIAILFFGVMVFIAYVYHQAKSVERKRKEESFQAHCENRLGAHVDVRV